MTEVDHRMREWVAGTSINDAVQAIKKHNRQGIHAIVNILGEHEEKPEIISQYVDGYIHLLDVIYHKHLDAMISIKPTQLGLHISKQYLHISIDPIIAKAIEYGIRVCFDMEDPMFHEDTLQTVVHYLRKYPNVGLVRVAIQADVIDSPREVQKIIDLGGTIRLCRGAYGKWDSDIPRHTDKKLIDLNLKTCAQLASHGKYRSSIATHDPELIKFFKTYRCFEFESLYGPKVSDFLKSFSKEPLSVYIPFGQNWLPYCKRRDSWFENVE